MADVYFRFWITLALMSHLSISKIKRSGIQKLSEYKYET